MSARAPAVPAADLFGLLRAPDGVLWHHGGRGFVGWGTREAIAVETGAGRFEAAGDAAARSLEGTDGIAFGSFTFGADDPGSVLVIPDGVMFEDGRTTGAPAPPARPSSTARDRVRYAGSTVAEVDWLGAVAESVRAIEAGRLDKLVLARDLLVWAKEPFSVAALTRRLAASFPQCYTFACEGLVGASPELLVRRTGERVDSLVLAGSAPRSADPVVDEALRRDLRASSKDRREHGYALDSVRAALAGICSELEVEEQPSVLALANVQHLATRVTGRLARPVDALRIVGLLHPTAAVCGTPRAQALEAIRVKEGMSRERYAGPVGWVDGAGDGEWAIALRCALLDGRRARLFAGAGIVEGSVPERELEETRLKLAAMRSALDAAFEL